MSEITMDMQRPHVTRHSRGKRPEFHDTPGVDESLSMIMVLANELAVLRDRLDSAERVAKASGLDLAAGIEALTLDQEALEAREEWRQDFLKRLFYLQLKEANEAVQAETAEGYSATIHDIAEQ